VAAPLSARDLEALVPTLTADLPDILSELLVLLREELPGYADFLAEDPDDLAQIAEQAVHQLVSIAQLVPRQRPTVSSDELGQNPMFEELGRAEWREGRSLDTLLSAYRAGARVAWRHIAAAASRRGLAADALSALAEAVFVFVDELSSASARGYVDEQRRTSAERERLRAQLAELLVSDRSDSTAVRATALLAGWTLPSRAALVLTEPGRDVGVALGRLDPQCLPLRYAGLSGAIIPDPEGPRRHEPIATALRGTGAVVGPAVPLEQLPTSVHVTAAGSRLLAAGIVTDDPMFITDHYDAVMVARDPWLLDRLREQVLAPLDGLAAGPRSRLEATLAAWLAAMGDRQAAALSLRVHPQTVRYRLRQLQELYGEDWHDPALRLKLTLAVCWTPPNDVTALSR
jgi:hypothetical protein